MNNLDHVLKPVCLFLSENVIEPCVRDGLDATVLSAGLIALVVVWIVKEFFVARSF